MGATGRGAWGHPESHSVLRGLKIETGDRYRACEGQSLPGTVGKHESRPLGLTGPYNSESRGDDLTCPQAELAALGKMVQPESKWDEAGGASPEKSPLHKALFALRAASLLICYIRA